MMERLDAFDAIFWPFCNGQIGCSHQADKRRTLGNLNSLLIGFQSHDLDMNERNG